MEGKTIRLEYRYAEGDQERLPPLASELIRLKVDVIVVGGGTTDVARKATTTIPIVVGSAGDLVGGGHVVSLAKPGGNVTGSTDISPDVSGKRLEVLKGVLPSSAQQIAVVFGGRKSDFDELKATEIAASNLGIKIHRVEFQRGDALEKTFQSMTKQKMNAVIFIQSADTLPHRTELSRLALKLRLPSMCETAVWTERMPDELWAGFDSLVATCGHFYR